MPSVKSTDDPEFDEFFRIFPRKEAKLDALKAWGQVLKTELTTSAIINGAIAFAKRCERDRTERKFVPLPASWLRAGRWMDEEMPAYAPKIMPHQAKETESENLQWEAWKVIRQSSVAKLGAEEGWAWNLKCAVLDGSVRSVEQINSAEFLRTHLRCSATEATKAAEVFKEPFLTTYLGGRRVLAIREAETWEEIYGGKRLLPPPSEPVPEPPEPPQGRQYWVDPLDTLDEF